MEDKKAKPDQPVAKTIKKQGRKLVQKLGMGRWQRVLGPKILFLLLNDRDLAWGVHAKLCSFSRYHANSRNVA